MTLYHGLKGDCSWVRASLFSQAIGDLMRGQSFKMCYGRSGLDIMKKFFTERVIRYWNGLPRDVVKSLSLKVFK